MNAPIRPDDTLKNIAANNNYRLDSDHQAVYAVLHEVLRDLYGDTESELADVLMQLPKIAADTCAGAPKYGEQNRYADGHTAYAYEVDQLAAEWGAR